MSAWIICATFCSRVNLRSSPAIRASIRSSGGAVAAFADPTDALATRDTRGGGCESRVGSVGLTVPNAAMTPQQDVRATENSQRDKADLVEWIIVGTYLNRCSLRRKGCIAARTFQPAISGGIWRRLAAIRENETRYKFKGCQKVTCMRT